MDTKQPEHGDYACNFALTASKVAGKNPRELGEMLAEALYGGEGQSEPFAAVEVAGPGFVNLRLNPAWIASFLPEILDKGDNLSQVLKSSGSQVPKRINLEFVSVNPNGPITIGSGRGAAYGSTLGNVLEAAGNSVHREYYINDGVNSEQMRGFAQSVKDYLLSRDVEWLAVPNPDHYARLEVLDNVAKAIGPGQGGQDTTFFLDQLRNFLTANSDARNLMQPWEGMLESVAESLKSRYMISYIGPQFRPFNLVFEELGYKGDYVADVARKISCDSLGWMEHMSDLSWFQNQSQARMLEAQRNNLAEFGVTFDTWFSEQSLHDSGVVDACIQHLIKNGTADEEPYRTKLKLAKGGKIEEVIRESQAEEDEDSNPPTLEQSNNPADFPLPGPPPSEIGEGVPESNTPTLQHANTPQSTLWLRSTKFGDDMDRVLRRKDGRLTYIASDVAYHKDKFNRPENADKLITILGPDHHGYIGRLQAVLAAQLLEKTDQTDSSDRSDQTQLYSSPEEEAACQAALAQAKEKLHVQIYQLVRFLKDGKPAPMRKRDGNIYALIDLIDEIGKKVKPTESVEEQRKVGKDVARFFYLMRSHDTTFDFDLDLAEKQSDENPVFYVQYAHARICSILKKAQESLGETTMETAGEAPVPVLTHEKELELIKKICDLPYEVERCAADYGVHRLTTYAIELARTFHHFYDACRVIQDDQPELTRARLALCQATKHALKSTFNLLGIEAPERMER